MKKLAFASVIIVTSLLPAQLSAQDLTFFRLDKTDGLSDNLVTSVVADNSGLLWVGTSNGLNSYNGYTVRKFNSKDYPGLANDEIVRMVCDLENRIWIQCRNGELTVLDENRNFQRINLSSGDSAISVHYLLPMVRHPTFIYNGEIYQLSEEGKLEFEKLATKDEPLLNGKFERINVWDDNHLVFSGDDSLFLFDVDKLTVSKSIHIPGIIAAARVTDDLALVTTANEERLAIVSFTSRTIVHRFGDVLDQHGESIHRLPGSVWHLSGSKFLIGSPSAGLYILDIEKKNLTRYAHNILDYKSIASNHTSYVTSDKDGFFFVSSFDAGLSYFSMNTRLAQVKTAFKDSNSATIYSGYVNCFAEDSEGDIWMAGSHALIEWNRSAEKISIHHHQYDNEQNDRGGVRTLYVDRVNRIWLGLNNTLLVLNGNMEIVKAFVNEDSLPDRTINKIVEGPDGQVWVCTANGLCSINPRDLSVTRFGEDHPFGILNGKNCNTIWFATENEVWIGTWEGAYSFNLTSGAKNHYSTDHGLLFPEVIGFARDSESHICIGTRLGFHVVEEGQPVRAFGQVNGVSQIDCYAMVNDQTGKVWFSNNDFIASYSDDTGFEIYDEEAGIDPSGFRFYSAFASSSGTIFFGSNKGVTYFKPDDITTPVSPFTVSIHQIETSDSIYTLLPNTKLILPFSPGYTSISFRKVNLLRGKNVAIDYKLNGVDRDWVSASSERITYNNLSPGDYEFLIRTSRPVLEQRVTFSILSPWWQWGWLRASALIVAGCIVSFIVVSRNRKSKRQRENLEIEKAINHLATSLHEQDGVDAILWDVTRNCISRLDFEDCVIYLVDEGKRVLVQKAAWGPKTTEENKILNPIEIPIGRGIVGSVAESGNPEIIPDTTKDGRYIVDDAHRLSELTVPIVYDGKVLGVIDSEHSKSPTSLIVIMFPTLILMVFLY